MNVKVTLNRFLICSIRHLLQFFLLLTVSLAAIAADVDIAAAPDQTVAQGSVYTYQPMVTSSAEVYWTKIFGPDDLTVNPGTGEVSWAVPATLPGESLHIGVRASNSAGSDDEVWVLTVGKDDCAQKTVYVGGQENHKTLKDAYSASDADCGAVRNIIVRDGTYSGSSNGLSGLQRPPEGNASQYVTLIAENPGAAVFSSGAQFEVSGNWGAYGYLTIKGLHVDGGYVASIGYFADQGCSHSAGCMPHHIKFVGNFIESSSAIPLLAFRSEDVLIENNYVYGGGRYKIATYQSSKVVIRRNVARYDFDIETGEPKATYAIYTTTDAVLQNNIAIDGKDEFVSQGENMGAFACPTTSGSSLVEYRKNIQLNSEFMVGNIDNQSGVCDAEYSDHISWDVRPAQVYLMSRAASWFNHSTFGEVQIRHADFGMFFNAWPSDYARGITNSILHNFSGSGGMFYGFQKADSVSLAGKTIGRYGIDNVNMTGVSAQLNAGGSSFINEGAITDTDPVYAAATNSNGGLRYLVRVEADSNLSSTAVKAFDSSSSTATSIGANVTTWVGKSGTMWGEQGYLDETSIPMWPFTGEDLGGLKMRAFSYTGAKYTGIPDEKASIGTGTLEGNRGFAATGQTLSNYVWGYLGSLVPPFGVSITVGTDAVVNWLPIASVNKQNIAGYRLRELSGTSVGPIVAEVAGNSATRMLVPAEYFDPSKQYVLTAFNQSEESAYSYIASITLIETETTEEPKAPPAKITSVSIQKVQN